MGEVLEFDRRTRIFLIEDHPVVRDALRAAFAAEGDFELVGEAASAAEAFERIDAARPDLAVVDLQLPDRDGADVIASLRASKPLLRIVVVSGHDDEYRVAEALRAGANGYLLKASPVTQIVAGIREAAAGGSPLTPALTDGVLRAMRRSSHEGRSAIDVLTPREIQVLRLFASGHSTREVAASLGISPKTVETHRVRIYTKLGAKGVVDLTRIAVRSGLVEA